MDESFNSTRANAPNSVEERRHDSAGTKPSGWPVDERWTPSETNAIRITKSVLSCKNATKIGTLNVRTIRTADKRLQLRYLFKKSGLQILAIQEHIIFHGEPILMTTLGRGSLLIKTSAWRNSSQAAVGGVGLVRSFRANQLVREITPVSLRVLKISFNGNPKLNVLSVCSPPDGDSDEAADEFHNEVRRAISVTPAHNFVLALGDAHLSKEWDRDLSWYYHDNTNCNGKLLRNTLLEANAEVTNLRFRKKPGKMWTYLSDMQLSKSQIDFILVKTKWRNSVMNTEAYDFFSSLGSDHRARLRPGGYCMTGQRSGRIVSYNRDTPWK